MNIEIKRSIRTSSSESYLFFNTEGRLGTLDLHYLQSIHGTLILEQELTELEVEELLKKIEEDIVDSIYPREDFIFSVYQGKEIGFYSDNISEDSRKYESARIKDIEGISKQLATVLGKQHNIRGKLAEHAGIEFFETLGYQCCLSRKIDKGLDHQKVDLVAEKNGETTFIQVKAGAISDKAIETMVKAMSLYTYSTPKNIAFLANEYSKNSEELRVYLESKYQMKIRFYHVYQVLKSLPEYKNSF